MTKPYHIDNEPADMDDIINMAKDLGYRNESGIYQTSICSGYLRKHGHIVGDACDLKKEVIK